MLTVEANRLPRWHKPGLLVIGDAAHAMSPVVPPWPLRLLLKTPYLRQIPARILGFGPRPYRLERAEEHPPA